LTRVPKSGHLLALRSQRYDDRARPHLRGRLNGEDEIDEEDDETPACHVGPVPPDVFILHGGAAPHQHRHFRSTRCHVLEITQASPVLQLCLGAVMRYIGIFPTSVEARGAPNYQTHLPRCPFARRPSIAVQVTRRRNSAVDRTLSHHLNVPIFLSGPYPACSYNSRVCAPSCVGCTTAG